MPIDTRRLAATIEGEFVVFLIGARINKPLAVRKWLPVVRAMPAMLTELAQHPELGLLHARSHFGLRNVMMVQYWRSWEKLHAYATGTTHVHLPAWQRFRREVSDEVGIWHETYRVRPGDYETIYHNMPAYGLGLAGRAVPAEGPMRSANGRLGEATGAAEAAPRVS